MHVENKDRSSHYGSSLRLRPQMSIYVWLVDGSLCKHQPLTLARKMAQYGDNDDIVSIRSLSSHYNGSIVGL